MGSRFAKIILGGPGNLKNERERENDKGAAASTQVLFCFVGVD